MKIKIIFLFFLIWGSRDICAQVERHGNTVWMPIDSYNKIRNQILLCDTIKGECDSLVTLQYKSIKTKDSIIVNLNNKVTLKDTIIANKNNTINLLVTTLPKENKFKVNKSFFMGVLAGIIGETFIIAQVMILRK